MSRKLRLDCSGKTSREVIDGLARGLLTPGNGRRLVLVVDNVHRIQDSLTTLLKKLLRFFNERQVRASIVDPSGCATTLYEALGGNVQVEVCRSEDEVSEPKEILIVEDTEDSLEFVQTLLEQAGHHVTAARTGKEALQVCAKRSFDLVLLDMVLPDIDGIAVARSLPAEKKPPIVVMSAYLDRWSEGDYAHAGLKRRLRKPFRVAELLDAVRRP
jgi:CheY-like chemotaxis protein